MTARGGHRFWDAADAWIAARLEPSDAHREAAQAALRLLDELDEGASSRN